MIRLIAIAALLISAQLSHGADWYVDNAAGGSNNGQSWLNAFSSFAAVTWGNIDPGDTLYISGGTTSKTYSSPLVVGKSGTSTNRITIRVGQDTGHTGTVIFDETYIRVLQNYITINGDVAGTNRILIQDRFDILNAESGTAVDAGNSTGLIVENITVNNCNNGVLLTRGSSYTIRNNTFTEMRGDYGIRGIISTGSWDTNKIHGNYMELLYNSAKPPGATLGYVGPDGVQPGNGTSIYDNYFVVHRTTKYTSAQHTDTIQVAGKQIKIYNNTFENIGDSNIDMDMWAGGILTDVYVYNNLFLLTEDIDPFPEYIRVYSTGEALNSISGLKFTNNTFIDERPSGAAPRIGYGFGGGSGAGAGNEFRNNVIVSPHGQVFSLDTGGGSFVMTYSNNVYPNTNAFDATGVVGVPSLDANYIPTSLDTLVLDKGMTLNYFATDKLGTSRPQGSAWDIGSFEYSGTAAIPEPPNPITALAIQGID